MATGIENLYKDFDEAMDLYTQAMETMAQSMAQLKTAENRLQSVMQHFMEYMGTEQADYNEPNIWDAGNLFKGISKGNKSFEDFFRLSDIF
jgi:exonuclease VII small subunit